MASAFPSECSEGNNFDIFGISHVLFARAEGFTYHKLTLYCLAQDWNTMSAQSIVRWYSVES